LIQQGFTSVFNLEGGITAWANEIDRDMTRY
jgi:rhodanese-related sulfurtransferase